jgi:hypothetical protein
MAQFRERSYALFGQFVARPASFEIGGGNFAHLAHWPHFLVQSNEVAVSLGMTQRCIGGEGIVGAR